MRTTTQIGGKSPFPTIPHMTSRICGVPAPEAAKPTEAKRPAAGGRNG